MPRTATEKDPEIEAMRSVNDALAGLDPKARDRVITWLLDRYPPPTDGKAYDYSQD